MASPNPNPRKVLLLVQFPNAPAPIRHSRGRGGRIRSTGSTRGGSTSFGTKGSSSKTPYSKGKEIWEPSLEPTVEEIIPNDLSFARDRASLQKQIAKLEKTDAYPSLINELNIHTIRKDCNWKEGVVCLSIASISQRISSY